MFAKEKRCSKDIKKTLIKQMFIPGGRKKGKLMSGKGA
jgi:hypothetical protein